MAGSQSSSGGSEQRMSELNEDTGSTASAEEFKERIEDTYGDADRGSAEGKPNPVTAESAPEEANTQQGGMQEVNTQDPIVPPSANPHPDREQYGATST